jgi:hypothetical protein
MQKAASSYAQMLRPSVLYTVQKDGLEIEEN